MFTVVEWNGGTDAAIRDLIVTETNLETGRPREHQVEFFFFKLVGDWPTAQRMGNYWRQHYGLETYPIDAVQDPSASPPGSRTEALDSATVSAVRLITEIRNLPGAASLEEYRNQLLSMVRASEVLPAFNSVQLSTLAIQFQQLADVVAATESSGTLPTAASLSMDTNPNADVHLTDVDDDNL
eukprot:s747_g15.t1